MEDAHPIKLVLQSVMILLKENDSWSNAVKIISAINFIDRLLDFDVDDISYPTVKRISEICDDP